MEHTEPDLDERVGPAERPDDPLAKARQHVADRPPTTPLKRPDSANKHAPPTPDQEGCYFLG